MDSCIRCTGVDTNFHDPIIDHGMLQAHPMAYNRVI